jgi:hypothetical protein
MSPDISDVWTQLERSNPVGEKINAKPALPDITNKFFGD